MWPDQKSHLTKFKVLTLLYQTYHTNNLTFLNIFTFHIEEEHWRTGWEGIGQAAEEETARKTLGRTKSKGEHPPIKQGQKKQIHPSFCYWLTDVGNPK